MCQHVEHQLCVNVRVTVCVCVCSLDDVLIGAPLFMDKVMEQLQERGQVEFISVADLSHYSRLLTQTLFTSLYLSQ